MSTGTITEQALALCFAYSRKGCPCNGSPAIYTKKVERKVQTLTIWEKRNVWRLTASGCVLANGTKENMTDKIQALWDL